MTKPAKPLNMLLLGHGVLGLSLLQQALLLQKQGLLRVVGVYAWSQHPGCTPHRYYQQQDAPIIRLAKQHHLPCLSGWYSDDPCFLAWLKTHTVNWVQMACWGEVLKPILFSQPDIDVLNCHPSLLPWQRGPNPYSAVVRQQLPSTGVSFHTVTAQLDKGPLLYQQAFMLPLGCKASQVQQLCAHHAALALPHVVALLQHTQAPTHCFLPGLKGTYDGDIEEADLLLDWQAPPQTMASLCRSLMTTPGLFVLWNNRIALQVPVIHTCPKPRQAPVGPAGTVYKAHWQSLWVYTCDPDVLFVWSGYRMLGPQFAWPACISAMIGRLCFTPDKGSFWHTQTKQSTAPKP